MRYISAVALALALTGCVSVEDQIGAVRNRAAYDFNCPPDAIAVTWVQSGMYGAEGCRLKQIYEVQGTQVYKEGMAPNPVYYDNYYGPRFGVGYGSYHYYRH